MYVRQNTARFGQMLKNITTDYDIKRLMVLPIGFLDISNVHLDVMLPRDLGCGREEFYTVHLLCLAFAKKRLAERAGSAAYIKDFVRSIGYKREEKSLFLNIVGIRRTVESGVFHIR
jgi:hypothetical protein